MSTTHAEPCRPRTLARNGVAHVQQCIACHCVSVHMGPVTVRLDDEGLEALWAILGEAAARLHAHRVDELALSPRGHA